MKYIKPYLQIFLVIAIAFFFCYMFLPTTFSITDDLGIAVFVGIVVSLLRSITFRFKPSYVSNLEFRDAKTQELPVMDVCELDALQRKTGIVWKAIGSVSSCSPRFTELIFANEMIGLVLMDISGRRMYSVVTYFAAGQSLETSNAVVIPGYKANVHVYSAPGVSLEALYEMHREHLRQLMMNEAYVPIPYPEMDRLKARIIDDTTKVVEHINSMSLWKRWKLATAYQLTVDKVEVSKAWSSQRDK